MPLSDHQTHYLPISSIFVDRDSRQRKTIKTEDLEKSIKKNGLFNPIIVKVNDPNGNWIITEAYSSTFTLVAGERRLTACLNLGWKEIPCIFASDLSPVELSIIELEENIKRTDLPWQDIVTAIHKIHQLNLQLDPDWTQAETADLCSVSPGHISECLLVANNLESPRVLEASSLREAYNILDRKFRRQEAESLEELLYIPEEKELQETKAANPQLISVPIPFVQSKPQSIPLVETILHQSFLEYSHSGPKFNFIHCDFPYGIDIFEGPQGRGAEPQEHYLNTPETYFTLVKHLCKSLNSISSMSCHIMFWYAEKFKLETLQIFRAFAPQIEWTINPLIWLKSDNAGISPDPRRLPRHIYETALLGSTSSRELVQVKADAYACPTDHKVHPSTKPESMLRHFFTMLVDENTRMFDPTCGGGSSIRAAESLGAQQVLGLEVDWNYCEAARLELKKFRTMRSL